MQLVNKSKAAGLRRTTKYLGAKRAPLALAVLAFTLAACADVPDAANPVEWYKSAKGVLTGESSDKSGEAGDPSNRLVADRDKPAPGAETQLLPASTPSRRTRMHLTPLMCWCIWTCCTVTGLAYLYVTVALAGSGVALL